MLCAVYDVDSTYPALTPKLHTAEKQQTHDASGFSTEQSILNLYNQVRQVVPRKTSVDSPMTASTVLPAGSSGRARAGRVGSVVGEELPEPVLDARLDATLELMLGASG